MPALAVRAMLWLRGWRHFPTIEAAISAPRTEMLLLAGRDGAWGR